MLVHKIAYTRFLHTMYRTSVCGTSRCSYHIDHVTAINECKEVTHEQSKVFVGVNGGCDVWVGEDM